MSNNLQNTTTDIFKEKFKLQYVWTMNDIFKITFLDVEECINVTKLFMDKIFKHPTIDDGEYAFRIEDFVDLNMNIVEGNPEVLGWQLVMDRTTERHIININKDTFKCVFKSAIKTDFKPEWEGMYPDLEKPSTDEVMMCVLGFFKTVEYYILKEDPISETNLFDIICVTNNGYCNVVM